MASRWRSITAVLMGAAVAASACTSAKDADAAAGGVDAANAEAAGWLTDLIARVKGPLDEADQEPADAVLDAGDTADEPAADSAALEAALVAAGLPAATAECVAKAFASNGLGVDEITALVPALAGGAAAITDNPAASAAVAAATPCLDSASLASLAGNNGLSALTNNALAANPALLSAFAANPAFLAALGTRNPELVAAASNGLLDADAASAVLAILAALLSGDSLDGLVPTNLSAAQLAALLAGLLALLPAEQRDELNGLSSLDLSQLEIDPASLSGDDAGALLVLLLPFLGSFFQGGATPVPDDPTQIYVPPDTDLSEVNPLYFVSVADFVAGLAQDGVRPEVAECLYYRWRAVDPRTLGVALGEDGAGDYGGYVALIAGAMTCLVNPGNFSK